MLTLYGIPNCDTVRKARKWLDKHAIAYHFHDFRKQGLSSDMLDPWFSSIGWQTLLNKRGLTWRNLDDSSKTNINEQTAKNIMLDAPAIIKRPVVVMDEQIWVGFNEKEWGKIFNV